MNELVVPTHKIYYACTRQPEIQEVTRILSYYDITAEINH